MADNTQLDLGSGGNLAATKEVTHGGDTAHVSVISLVGVSGTEGAYTIADIDGTAANGLEVDVTRVQGNVAVTIAQDVMLGTDFSAVLGSASLVATDAGAHGASQIGLRAMGTDGTNDQQISVNASGHVNIADGGNTITVDGTVNAAQSGTWNITNVSGTVSLPTGAATSANQPPVVTDGSAAGTQGNHLLGTDGTNAQIISTNTSGHVNIADGGNIITVDGTVNAAQSGAWNITNISGTVSLPTGAATAANQLPDGHNVTVDNAAGTNAVPVQGDAAHDAAATGNPVLLGAQMETMADSAPGTRSSADGDATKLATSDGAIFVAGRGPQSWSYHEDSSSALTDATVHAAPGAGLSLYVTDIVFSSGAATAINVFFEEGVTRVLGPYYLEAVAGRGLAIHFQTPKKITANTALTVTTSAAIAHGIDVQGFIAPG